MIYQISHKMSWQMILTHNFLWNIWWAPFLPVENDYFPLRLPHNKAFILKCFNRKYLLGGGSRFHFLDVHNWQCCTMKILTVFSLFSTYLLADSVNIEVSVKLWHLSLKFPLICVFYVAFHQKRRSLVSLLCCHASQLAAVLVMSWNLIKTRKYIHLFSLVIQDSAGQFFSSGHTNNWAVLVSIYWCFIFARGWLVTCYYQYCAKIMGAVDTCLCLFFFYICVLCVLIHRCVHPDSGSTTVMWPILCLSTEVLRDWASLTGMLKLLSYYCIKAATISPFCFSWQ